MKRLILAAALSFSALPLFASADLSITKVSTTSSVVIAGTEINLVYFVHNAGPDAASNVIVTFTVTGATVVDSCLFSGCPNTNSDLRAGDYRYFSVRLSPPDTPGNVTITAAATSSTSDPNTTDNSVTSTLTISPDPDVTISLVAPEQLDLGSPFKLTVVFGNLSAIAAHDLNATIDFRADAGVQSLPAGCANPTPGRITCHLDVVTQGNVPAYNMTLVAPANYATGTIEFTAAVTESEHDFNPLSNTATGVSQLNNTFFVTSTANEGSGSLRQAILDANAFCLGGPICSIAFRIAEPSTTGWKTIRITSPLPALTASHIKIDGASQSNSFGDRNPDGPDIEISGGGTVDGDGLTIEGCGTGVGNLAINGFRRNGISVTSAPFAGCSPKTVLHDLFVGTDPTGSQARPNGERGIGVSVAAVTDPLFGNNEFAGTQIYGCVISGNGRSGIFDLSGIVVIFGNRIGVKAHSDDPLPNGASGIFIGLGGGQSSVGFYTFSPTLAGNVIAFNREMGVAIAAGVLDVSVRGNRIWNNGLLGIDIGLDGPTMSTTSDSNTPIIAPALTLAHYDPVSKATIVEGDVVAHSNGGNPQFPVDFYANDAPDPSGFGEGQRPLTTTTLTFTSSLTHFHAEFAGDLTGQFITATVTNVNLYSFAKPEGNDGATLTQTSEFSRAIEVR